MFDDGYLPDPFDAGFLARYVEVCRRAGVEPRSPQRVRELVEKWNALIRGEPSEPEVHRGAKPH